MKSMDHDIAIKNKVAERYLLGELNLAEMEEYEEHFFICAECAQEVKLGSEFIDHAREVFKTDFFPEPGPVPVAKSTIWGRFFSSLRVPVPAFACALLALVGLSIYQSAVIGDLKKPEVLAAAKMTLRNARGPGDAPLQVGPNQPFSLKFDITSEEHFSAYEVQLIDHSGRNLVSQNVSAEEAKDHLQMNFRGGTLKPGDYKVVIRGINKESSERPEIANYSFALAFQN
jgi:hypothetical protein